MTAMRAAFSEAARLLLSIGMQHLLMETLYSYGYKWL
jgi:hypothetical protein